MKKKPSLSTFRAQVRTAVAGYLCAIQDVIGEISGPPKKIAAIVNHAQKLAELIGVPLIKGRYKFRRFRSKGER